MWQPSPGKLVFFSIVCGLFKFSRVSVTFWLRTFKSAFVFFSILAFERIESCAFLCRKCADNQVFYKKNDTLPYCKNSCERITMCGEVAVPYEHLDVSAQAPNSPLAWSNMCHVTLKDMFWYLNLKTSLFWKTCLSVVKFFFPLFFWNYCHVFQFFHVLFLFFVFQSCRVCDGLGRDCREIEGPGGRGILDADFVFYVSAMETERCHKGMTVAYAAHCQQESSLDRCDLFVKSSDHSFTFFVARCTPFKRVQVGDEKSCFRI